MEEAKVLQWLVEGLLAACAAMGGWVIRAQEKRICDAEEDSRGVRQELEAHKLDAERYKLEAEQRFAKDIAVQATLARLHERIDGVHSRVDEIGVDVKAILRKCGENNCAH